MEKRMKCYMLIESILQNEDIEEVTNTLESIVYRLGTPKLASISMFEAGYFLDLESNNPSFEYTALSVISICKTASVYNSAIFDELCDLYLKDLPFKNVSQETRLKFKNVLKYIDSVNVTKIIDKADLPSEHRVELSLLSRVVISFAGDLICSSILKSIRTEGYCDILFYKIGREEDRHAFGCSCTILELGGLAVDIFTEADTYAVNTECNIDIGEYYNREVSKLKSELETYRKMLPKAEYKPQVKDDIQVVANIDNIYNAEDNLVEVNVELSDDDKRSLVLNKNILILKSKALNISDLSTSVKVMNIEDVSKETLRGMYDCIVIITKRIGHKSSFRVNSLALSKVITVSSTNKSKLLMEIYSKLFGGCSNEA